MLDRLYAESAAARRRWYERHPRARRRLRRPVVSIGNLTVGGSGKTPLVARVASHLLDQGERPAILSRGYGRADRADGVVVVSDGTCVLATLDRAGDEPLMLARQVPGAVVAVAEDRHLAGLVAERRLGATVHVLDDGFQHVQLARDLDVLLTRPGEIGGGRTLPFGRLREGAEAAARADLVVVLDADLDTARREAFDLGISQVLAARKRLLPVVQARLEQGSLASLPSRAPVVEQGSVASLSSRGSAGFGASLVLAVAGVARPEQFFDMLREAGHALAQTIVFADHHRYDARDVARLADAVRSAGAEGVVTTEKDAVRFEAIGTLPFPLWVAPMELACEGWDTLAACLEAAMARRRESL